jgi:hypothetical protein
METSLRHFGEKLKANIESLRPELIWLGWAAAGFLCGRSELLEGMRPFGAAFIVAVGAAGYPALPALIGSCIGTLSQGFDVFNAAVLVPPILAYFAVFVISKSRLKTFVASAPSSASAASPSLSRQSLSSATPMPASRHF